MADPRWRIQDGGQPFKILDLYCFQLLFLAVQMFPRYKFIRKDSKKDHYTNIIDILRI